MPTFTHGKSTRVLLDKYDATYWLRDAQWANAVDVAETSAFGSTAKTYVVGQNGFTMQMNGMYDETASTGFDAVASNLLGQETSIVTAIAPRNTDAGNKVWACQGYITAYQVQGTVGDMVSAGVQIQGSDTVRQGVSLQKHTTAVSATGTGTTVNLGTSPSASTAFGAQAFLFVPTNTRDAGTLSVTVEHSTNGSVWGALDGGFTFPNVTAGTANVTSAYKATAASATVNQYVRVNYTVTGGTTGSYFFTVIFVRLPQ